MIGGFTVFCVISKEIAARFFFMAVYKEKCDAKTLFMPSHSLLREGEAEDRSSEVYSLRPWEEVVHERQMR